MPILHFQLRGVNKAPDGAETPIPPGIVLAAKGPCVRAVVTAPAEVATQLSKDGKPIPAPVTGFALIDTGATSSCLDDQIAKQLQLPIVDVVKMASASHASVDSNVYPVTFDIVGDA